MRTKCREIERTDAEFLGCLECTGVDFKVSVCLFVMHASSSMPMWETYH